MMDRGNLTVDDENTGELNAACQAYSKDGPFPIRLLCQQRYPAVRQRIVQLDLGSDLRELNLRLITFMQLLQDNPRFGNLAILDEIARRFREPLHERRQ